MMVEEYHSPVRFFSRGYMVHPGRDSPRKAWSALLIAEQPGKVSDGSRTLLCIKGSISFRIVQAKRAQERQTLLMRRFLKMQKKEITK